MSVTADVLVIGAGVLGASTGFELARRGHRVAVVDRGSVSREGSGTTAGNLHVQAVHTRRPGQDVPLDARRFLPLQKAASDLWEAVPDLLGIDIELVRTGGFTVAETAEQLQELKLKGEWEREFGVQTVLMDQDTVHDALPALGPTVLGATWCAEDGYANPLLVTPAYLNAARRSGAQITPHAPVTALSRDHNGWRADAGATQLHVGAVVDTAGPWLADVAALAGVVLAMAPLTIQMHATTRMPPLLRNLVQHIGEGLSIKQVTSGTILIGGGWPSGPIAAGSRTASSMASLMGNIAQAVRILPVLGQMRLLRSWAGPLAATPDEMPVVGAVPGLDDFYLAGGTYAFTFAPLWAQTLADLVEGKQPPVDLSGLGPDRLVIEGGDHGQEH
ncbi:MAG: dmg 2 [Pseudonocardiales bacterium]|nr:dmg 2 [Pseudonocardiales bacterium]